MRNLPRNSGMGLVEILVSITLLSVIVAGIAMLMKNMKNAERGVSADSELTGMVGTMRMIVDTRASCAKSGLIGVTLDPAAPSTTPITMNYPGTTGPAAVFLEEGKAIVETRKIKKLRFDSLAFIENVPAGKSYLGTLRAETELIGTGSTFRNPQRDLLLRVVLDAANKIVECYGSVGGSNLDCVYRSSGWVSWSVGQTLWAVCPAYYSVSTCLTDYYDNNGIVYHGAGPSVMTADKKSCFSTSGDSGIDQGQVSAFCCRTF